MPVKLAMPDDDTPKKRKRIATAKGQTPQPDPNSNPNTEQRYVSGSTAYSSITRNAQFAGSAANIAISQPMFFSPLHTPQNWQTASKRKEVYQWARFYYENEPKVAAGVDFYAQFPMNGFELECSDDKIRQFFELEVVTKLKLNYWAKLISHEYFLLGDVFPFLEIECKECHGKGKKKDGKVCNHPDGKFKSITILNPDFVEVDDSPFPDQRKIKLIPDDSFKRIISTGEPRDIFDKIPDDIKKLVAGGQPIPLSLRSVSHIKHSETPYGKYGTSMLRRLFTVLAYKTKLMTANWIIAERMILPVRVVKIGSDDRPAGADDIADAQQQMVAVQNDPNLCIVTHHNFEYEWYGATGKIHNIQGEIEQIGKEILDGLMLNQALLNGEMQGYTSAQVGIETLIKRLESWRHTLADWIEEHIFKPTAQMQGFIDEEATKEHGKTIYMYPKIKWNDMQLRDKTNRLQMFMQLHDKGLIATETLLNEFDLDYDQEIERIRSQQVMSQPGSGGAMPGGAGGGMPAMGGGGGGAPPGGDMGMGGMPPGGGAPGGPMGGGGAPGGGGMGGAPGGMGSAAGGGGDGKVYKKGKAPKAKQEEQQFVPPSFVKLNRIEQKLWKAIESLQLPFQLYGQYKQQLPGQPQPYIMDFAFPEIGVDIESDGKIWHEKEGQKEKDATRDRGLAQYGWRVIRFTEDAIKNQLDTVKKVISDNIKEAAEERFSRRKNAGSEETVKYAGDQGIYGEESILNEYFVSSGADVETGTGEIVQVVYGEYNDSSSIQPEADSSGTEKDTGSGDQLERVLPPEIEIPEEEI